LFWWGFSRGGLACCGTERRVRIDRFSQPAKNVRDLAPPYVGKCGLALELLDERGSFVVTCDTLKACDPVSASPDIRRVRRVMLVISELRRGGAERVVVHLASTVRSLGAAVEIVCVRNPGGLAAEAEAAGVPVVALRSLRGYDVKAVFALAKEMRRFRPDVIHVHDRSSLPYVVMANWMGGRRPIVLSAHGLLVHNEHPRRRDRLAARSLARMTAVSKPAADEYARLCGWKGEVEVIDNGVPPVERSEELGRQLRRSLGIADDTFVYLAVGNIKPEKGFEDLLAAAAVLRELLKTRQRGQSPFCVLIAGGVTDEEYHARLMARHKELGLDGVVQFLGLRSDTQSLYSAADAFVLSSRKEGLPMVLLEAMSAGLPVAATEVGAVPEVVGQGEAGLLVPPASADLLAAAMFRLFSEPALRASVGSAAQAKIKSRYGVERMAERYMEVYARGVGDVADNASGSESGKATGSATARDARPAVLMLGPMPPLTGGMATVACNLRDSDLRRWCDLETINTGKTTPEGRSFLTGAWAQIRLLQGILSDIRRRRVRIVHIHTCALFSFWRDIVHMIAIRLVGSRVIWHLHDGTFPRFISEGHSIKRAIIRWTLEQGDATIVLSNEALALLQPHAPKVRWQVVLNGVPTHERPSRDDRNRADPTNGTVPFSSDENWDSPPVLSADNTAIASLKLLFLGNLTRRKGAYDLIEAVEAAAKRGVCATLSLAGGETAPGQRREIEQRIAESPCADRIHLLGLVHGEAKQHALDEADCIGLPSYAEGLPMALLEGMAAGLPAIATDVGSIPAVVTDGVEGFLISIGDVHTLALRICRLAQDPMLCRRMGQNARERVEREFSQRVMAERVYQIYLSAVAG